MTRKLIIDTDCGIDDAIAIRELEELRQMAARLETGETLAGMNLSEPTEKTVKSFQLFTLKPELAVVNCAGFGLVGGVDELDRGEQLAMVDLNVRALTELSLRFADSLARHRGGILNVASVSAFLPGPGMAVYNATS